MSEAILANYTRDGDDWSVEVSHGDDTLSATAPGLIAARDRADQLAEQISPAARRRTVVHTLDGDALGFTEAYLTARLAKAPESDEQPGVDTPADTADPGDSADPNKDDDPNKDTDTAADGDDAAQDGAATA
ncbi:hypothetical protein [Actinokineospora bangkokensis]|uniref:Uncharacterized protein n=1 Tax=Actinokineospora bangkokensis TaxID=1193682 RepID=A0A1Q9LBT6_9PSEU|nr:hypothetical protein [Actinokineospora bangkokensis]OLR89491.1 hypothetical protein BJP25_05240 [Actinokineospora bangkokensis]